MSRRHKLRQHLQRLGEIRKIIASMRSLASLQVSRAERYLRHQQRVLETVEAATRELLGHYPALRPAAPEGGEWLLVIGSERGFCGGFNAQLISQLGLQGKSPPLLVVGQKLAERLEGDLRLAHVVAGPTVAEEVPRQLDRLVAEMRELNPDGRSLQLSVLCHQGEGELPRIVTLLPPFGEWALADPVDPYPPLLNLAPEQLFEELVDHYLFSRLHTLLYGSLLAESRHRVQHLDGAVERIDEHLERISHRGERLRQEEITEEIEVLLLGADHPLPGGLDHVRVNEVAEAAIEMFHD